MFHVLRKSRRFVSPIALLLAAYVFLGTADWWHAWDDDQDDQSVALFHDHAAHHAVLGSKGTPGASNDHCYLCHWLRLLGNGLGRGTLHKLQATETRSLPAAPAVLPAALIASHVPARAPPA